MWFLESSPKICDGNGRLKLRLLAAKSPCCAGQSLPSVCVVWRCIFVLNHVSGRAVCSSYGDLFFSKCLNLPPNLPVDFDPMLWFWLELFSTDGVLLQLVWRHFSLFIKKAWVYSNGTHIMPLEKFQWIFCYDILNKFSKLILDMWVSLLSTMAILMIAMTENSIPAEKWDEILPIDLNHVKKNEI